MKHLKSRRVKGVRRALKTRKYVRRGGGPNYGPTQSEINQRSKELDDEYEERKKQEERKRKKGLIPIQMTVEIARAILKKREDLEKLCAATQANSKWGGLSSTCPSGCKYIPQYRENIKNEKGRWNSVYSKKCVPVYTSLTAKSNPLYRLPVLGLLTYNEAGISDEDRRESEIDSKDLERFLGLI